MTNRTTFGPALACYVYAELLRLATWSEDSYELFMYRDKDQLEVDVVIANGLGQLVGVGVKAAASVQAFQCVGSRRLASQAGDRFLGGVIPYDAIEELSRNRSAMGPVAANAGPIWWASSTGGRRW